MSLHPHPELALALAHHRAGRTAQAEQIYRRILNAEPLFAEPYFHLGNLLQALGRVNEAAESFQRLVQLEPQMAQAYVNLGNALSLLDRFDEAEAAYQRAIELNPQLPRAHSNRATLLYRRNRLDEAAESCRRAIAVAPQFAEAHNNLGTILLRQGLIDQAIDAYQTAINLAPDYHQAQSNRLFALHYHPRYTPEQILGAHREWASQHADPITKRVPALASSNPGTLRIGFISPDLRDHPVGRFMLPILEHLDKHSFEIHCFSDIRTPDGITRRLMQHADHWHQTAALPDAHLAELIRGKQIDVLIDLALHTAGNRLMTLAYKPAPIQLTYLAYPGTSGMQALDYRITDAQLDPPGSAGFYSERSIYLKHYWCYAEPDEAPDVNPLPAHATGTVTFGCLNATAKLSDPALALWSEILDAVPSLRLILHADTGSHRQRIINTLRATNDISPERIEFVPRQSRSDYFRTYHRIDIALDPFPFCGGMTTCDALWMGVPVITLAGQTATSRLGVSTLSAIGASELIAHSHGQYVQLARSLATDLSQSEALRSALRQRMKESPLMNWAGFVQNFQEMLRSLRT